MESEGVTRVMFVLCYQVQQMKSEGRLGLDSRSTSQSVTSLDKESREANNPPQVSVDLECTFISLMC